MIVIVIWMIEFKYFVSLNVNLKETTGNVYMISLIL